MSASDRWKDISALYAAALERAGSDRHAFLAEACLDDEGLRQEVESLLACHADAQRTLTSPAVHVMADAIAADSQMLVGRQLGAYRIDAPLGSGGMGEVYRATDTRLHRAVALKILPSHLRDDPALRERFEREAQTVAALHHPHICVLYDVGHAEGIDFLVMELLEGETLASRLARGPLPIREALQHAIAIADALAHVHAHQLVHRDLKPGNIMLSGHGVKVLDFGLATLAASRPGSSPGDQSLGLIAGTLAYMAPEQMRGEPCDARTDIYGFGAILYELVTGDRLYHQPAASRRASSPDVVLAPNTDVNGSLVRFLSRCLQPVPRLRWQTASEMASALRALASELNAPLTPRRSVTRLPIAALLVMTALIGASFWTENHDAVPLVNPTQRNTSTPSLNAPAPMVADTEGREAPVNRGESPNRGQQSISTGATVSDGIVNGQHRRSPPTTRTDAIDPAVARPVAEPRVEGAQRSEVSTVPSLEAAFARPLVVGSTTPGPAARPLLRNGSIGLLLNITVTDRSRNHVKLLSESNFAVFEDGVSQQVSLVPSEDIPIAVSVLIDTSAGAAEDLPSVQRAASAFIQRLRTGDVTQIISFGERMDVQPFTSNREESADAISRAAAAFSAAKLRDALFTGLHSQQRLQADGAWRGAIVVFTAGEDTGSLVPRSQVLGLAQHTDAAIYFVITGTPSSPAAQEERAFAARVAEETGGRLVNVTPGSLEKASIQLADELMNQYSLWYWPGSTRPGLRRISVQVPGMDVVARTKRAYYAPRDRQ